VAETVIQRRVLTLTLFCGLNGSFESEIREVGTSIADRKADFLTQLGVAGSSPSINFGFVVLYF